MGHIHKAQKIAGQENIRYAGSPLPMSFSELNYRHQVVILEVEGKEVIDISFLDIPVRVELLRIPSRPKTLDRVLFELQQLPTSLDNKEHAPYLEVRVLLDGPEPSLRYKIETAIQNKYVRLAKIDVQYKSTDFLDTEAFFASDQLPELETVQVFRKIYQSRFNNEVPAELIALFNEVSLEVSTNEQ